MGRCKSNIDNERNLLQLDIQHLLQSDYPAPRENAATYWNYGKRASRDSGKLGAETPSVQGDQGTHSGALQVLKP